MITTREFFEHDAEDIISNIEIIYSVQREESNKYLFELFRSKADEEQSTIITEQKARISNVYNKIQKEREAFMKTVG